MRRCDRLYRRSSAGQAADPGVTLIMSGVGVAILGMALIVLVVRTLLARAVREMSTPHRCGRSRTR